jgi:hypothetical protein
MAETNGGVPFFGNKSLMLGVAFIMSLVAFVIIALAVGEVDWLWILGLVVLIAGLALAPLARFTASGEEDEEEGGDESEGDEGRSDKGDKDEGGAGQGDKDDKSESRAGEGDKDEGRAGEGDKDRGTGDDDDEGRGARRA